MDPLLNSIVYNKGARLQGEPYLMYLQRMTNLGYDFNTIEKMWNEWEIACDRRFAVREKVKPKQHYAVLFYTAGIK